MLDERWSNNIDDTTQTLGSEWIHVHSSKMVESLDHRIIQISIIWNKHLLQC